LCLTTDWTTGVRSPAEAKDFSSSLCPNQLWGPPSLLSNGYRGSFHGSKARPGRDADHSPHLVSRSRRSKNYTSSPPWRLHGVAGQLCFTLLSITTSQARSHARVYRLIIFGRSSADSRPICVTHRGATVCSFLPEADLDTNIN
jgi:hypothetical protein